MPDVSGDKTRYATYDAGATYEYGGKIEINSDTDSKVGFKPAFGVQINIPSIYGALRAEIEYTDYGTMTSKIENEYPIFSSIETDVSGVFGNLYWVIDTNSRVKPYFGAGAGYNSYDVKAVYSNGGYFGIAEQSDRGFGYNFSLGLEMYLASNITFDLGYRYSNVGKVDFSMRASQTVLTGSPPVQITSPVWRDDFSMDIMAHEITFGLRYRF
jgi:opacity protein-like surface antigen